MTTANEPDISPSQTEPLGVKSMSEKRTFTATVTDFDPQECGGFRVVAAVASFALKGEDRYTFVTCSSEPLLDKCQSKDSLAKLVAFAGVFDGHDGEAASHYCCKGMLHHILAETDRLTHKLTETTKRGRKKSLSMPLPSASSKDINIQLLKQGQVNGYTSAQTRFGTGADPPTFADVNDGHVRSNQSLFGKFFCGTRRSIRGGTTATCISLYSKGDGGSPVPCALVACAGDSRCITDDGCVDGVMNFRNVTKDHRPAEPDEARRLQTCVKRGTVLIAKDDNIFGTLRIYPGGLAVSRTVGDLAFTEAAVPTPEVFIVPLAAATTFRFVIASDGLWDVFKTDEVGAMVAQETADQEPRSPKKAAKELLDACIKHGGYEDDVTLLIMDVMVL